LVVATFGAQPDGCVTPTCKHQCNMTEAEVSAAGRGGLVELPVEPGLWTRVFAVAPLVLVGTREGEGYNFAPKHMAMPLGWEGFYCFVCSPRHATYRNIRAHPQFTVSFPQPGQIVESSLAAGGRLADDEKPALAALPIASARVVDVPFVDGCTVYLECELDRIVDGFGPNSLIVGRVVSASAAREAVRGVEVDDADLIYRLGLLAYLAPGRFAVVRDSLAFPYPIDFRA
jgi:flavin reductase (DIM6/NTAB) family NADH-FMN oxidoreductase RutF